MASDPTTPDGAERAPPSAARQTLINLLVRGGAIPLALCVNAVLSRVLPVDQFGLYGALLGGLLVAAMPLVTTLSTLLIREIGKLARDHDGARICGALTGALALMISVSVLFTLLVVAGQAAPLTGNLALMQSTLGTLMPLYPVLLITLVAGAALRALGQVTVGILPEQILRQFGFVCAMGIAYTCCAPATDARWAFTMQMYGTAAAGALALMMLWRALARAGYLTRPAIDWSPWRRSALPLLTLGLFQIANTHLPVIALGVMAPLADAAYFRVADQIAGVALLPLVAANLALGPVAARYRRGERAPELQRELRRVGLLVWFLSLPLLGIMCLFPGDILALVFGEDYRVAANLLVILAVATTVSALTGPVGLVLNMLGHERETLRAMGIALLLTIALTAALAPSLGALGAAIAAALAKISWNVILFVRLRRLEGYSTLPAVRGSLRR